MNGAQTTNHRTGARWRLPLFQSILPLDRSGLATNLAAGVSLAAMNIRQAMGYAKIAGMPVVTGLYTLLLPLVAFAAFGSSSYPVGCHTWRATGIPFSIRSDRLASIQQTEWVNPCRNKEHVITRKVNLCCEA